MRQKEILLEGPHIELHPIESTEVDRRATLMAFALHLPIMYISDDGSIFAYMLPHENKQTDEDA